VLLGDLRLRPADEWRAAGEGLIHHASDGVQVGVGTGRAALHLLRRHVGRGAHDGAAGPEATAPGGGGDAEVGELRAAIVGEQYIVGLDVAVHDALLVGVGQCAAALYGDVNDLLFRERRPLLDDPLEVWFGEALHHDVVDVAVHTGVVDLDDVGVVELGGRVGLPSEACHGVGAGGDLVAQHLDGHLSGEREVHSAPYEGHSAFADHGIQSVAACYGRPAFEVAHLPSLPAGESLRSASRARVGEGACRGIRRGPSHPGPEGQSPRATAMVGTWACEPIAEAPVRVREAVGPCRPKAMACL